MSREGRQNRNLKICITQAAIKRLFLRLEKPMTALNPPSHQQAYQFVLLLNPEQREYFEERAAIYEFEGGLNCETSELKAIEAVLKQWPELATIWPKS